MDGNPRSDADPLGLTPAGAAVGGRIGGWVGGAVGEVIDPVGGGVPGGAAIGSALGELPSRGAPFALRIRAHPFA